ncbi:hypothetical protein Patl1_18536 [Pistacia atlantica]|uniref:Uncharacterized protein n=1 Tax=Pistacia atlantica TaxID=434234 RepID=A0ACC1C0W0_9ROSI|nr:hypothetical protein Patl1_18536 [Pistacia atlantica]
MDCPTELHLQAAKRILRRILEGLNHAQHDSTTIYCDNSSAIKLSKSPVMHGHYKHIDVHFHFLRELTKDGIVKMVHCHTQEQVVDIKTKPLKLDALLKICDLLGVCSQTFKVFGQQCPLYLKQIVDHHRHPTTIVGN